MKLFLILLIVLCACDSKEIDGAKRQIDSTYNDIKKAGEYIDKGKAVVKEKIEVLKKETEAAKETVNKTFGKDIEEAKSLFKK